MIWGDFPQKLCLCSCSPAHGLESLIVAVCCCYKRGGIFWAGLHHGPPNWGWDWLWRGSNLSNTTTGSSDEALQNWTNVGTVLNCLNYFKIKTDFLLCRILQPTPWPKIAKWCSTGLSCKTGLVRVPTQIQLELWKINSYLKHSVFIAQICGWPVLLKVRPVWAKKEKQPIHQQLLKSLHVNLFALNFFKSLWP